MSPLSSGVVVGRSELFIPPIAFMALPNDIPEEVLHVDEGEIRTALGGVFRRTLKPIVMGLAILYCVYAFGHPVFIDGTAGLVLSAISATTGLLFFGLQYGWEKLPRRSPWPHGMGAVVAGLVLINILLHLVLTDDLSQTTNLLLLLLAIGALTLSTAWYAAMVGGTVGAWGLAVWMTLPHDQLSHYGFSVVSAVVLATVLHRVRRQSAWQEQRERLAGRQLRTALAQSLQTEAGTRRALEESNAALEKAVLEARETNRLQAAFLADVSHEIRTPLTSIIGFAEVIEEEVTGEVERFTALLLESSRRLLETLNSVLDLSKLNREEIHLEPERVNVSKELRDTVRLFRTQARDAGVALSLDVPPTLAAELDPSALHRCCSNLVGNAIKYTDEGGSVTVRALGESGVLLVEVADTGIGIDPAFQETLFDPFQQSETGEDREGAGTGLGLAITRRLVSLMDGTISVESTPGEGSVFTIRLPRGGEVEAEDG